MAMKKVTALSGGVGGAKLVEGLASILPPEDLRVIVNNGDDFDHLGLRICPDLDTVLYMLAGVAHPEHGWGRAGESLTVLETLKELGGPGWFQLGDKDLALHLRRTQLLSAGLSLSEVTAELCSRFGVQCSVLPASDDEVSTVVVTESEGELPFQEYFVARRCKPAVRGFLFTAAKHAKPAPGVLAAVEGADLVVFGPSNPWVSIDPILALPGLREALMEKKVVAVSPIVGGKALKGPAAKMFSELGINPSAAAAAGHYGSVLDGFVIDAEDRQYAGEIEKMGIRVLATDTIMKDAKDRERLAKEVLDFASKW